MKVLLATMNKGKVMELEGLLNDGKIEILSLSDLSDYQEVEESGSTFAENAFIKARAACATGKMITLADDSGLEVDALAGAPGVLSARYAGEPKNDEHNIEKLLTDLEGVPEENRTARFRCALAIICPDGQEYLTEGSVEGRILTERIGTGGFGYDPVFYLPDLQKTMAELSLDEKNCLSHRARAFAKAVPLLTALMKSL
ncbi:MULTISPECIES: XTP/dITP diphosphatase [unclassified Dehalobacter]|jgi:non-canonical purine NTP pyrophosphatase, rdgB/HAM1 family|uniref:XTP/dITP diphosphatase n=1 Tax=unclassified Dehalobacter TaxID=2635733 RepID=UPI00028B7847|nr:MULTISPECIES: XTP/dITP diphosphatase [unclassified Dehalobacter]AFV03663.1 Nucleoside 5-triphosphatase RdgB (dHAPTP, dITP, XTP-specific) [Dehalobacter sp. DCA]AFV06650.1 Nucleoside 5-triphosphatase RdgB (dHAPTP, dITP, XTP-specific) [Dehalobacter sp. CF]EQB20344.1 Nucleoside 5-triphosphatase RdgB (dHAPTP, dITP, XTP-specific) [Dehalobacter sp. UNSWDHB]MDJ0305101.1 XTP/dITP diphosphatase [Dehalobacter sp.]